MAKKAKKAKKAPKPKTPARAAGRTAASITPNEFKASAIVGEVMSNFGGGYEAERQNETAGTATMPAPIYKNAAVAKQFHFALFESTLRNLNRIDWDINPGLRAQVSSAAFKHGRLARQRVVADGTGTLTTVQLFETLQTIKTTDCPGVVGGGLVCDF
jgi:hypothetical protein